MSLYCSINIIYTCTVLYSPIQITEFRCSVISMATGV